MIAHTIEAAMESGLFAEIVVSSETSEILSVAASYGAIPDARPSDLSRDEVRIIEVLQEFIRRQNLSADTVIGILLATCPLRLPEDIRRAFELFVQNGGGVPVVSVTPYERPIQVAHFIDAQNRLTPVFPEDYLKTTRSQEHEVAYWYNGGVIFNTARRLATQRTLIGDEPIPYVMPFERSIDIDHEFQVQLVEFLLQGCKKGG